MKLLTARAILQEYNDTEQGIADAKRDKKFLDTDLKQTKKTRDSNNKNPGLFNYHNAKVILIRQGIKYWNNYIEEAQDRLKELMANFELEK